MRHSFLLSYILFSLLCPLFAAEYKQAPEPIRHILEAPRAPYLQSAPIGDLALIVSRSDAPTIQDIAFRAVEVAGLRIDPRNNGLANPTYIESLELVNMKTHERRQLEMPDGRIDDLRWDREGERFAFTLTVDEGIELWYFDVRKDRAHRLSDACLNAVMGTPYDWLPGDAGFVALMVPTDRDTSPPQGAAGGPIVEESSQKISAGRTWQNLIEDDQDEALFVYYASSVLTRISLKGKVEVLSSPMLWDGVTPSPDGSLLLSRAYPAPFPRQQPLWHFAKHIDIYDLNGERVFRVADLPLADTVPAAFGSVRTGRRSAEWRSDRPAEIVWVEALDGGDAGCEAEWRDAVYHLEAPFTGEAKELTKLGYRYYGINWGNDHLAMISEGWYKTRQRRDWIIDPSSGEKHLLFELNVEDSYADPGSPLYDYNEYGEAVLLIDQEGMLYYTGRGASPDGVYPFLDRLNPVNAESERLWQCEDPYYTRVLRALHGDPDELLMYRQSQEEPPNYFWWDRKTNEQWQVTEYQDPAPELAGIQKEIVRYMRSDSLELSATLYTPPGYDSVKDGPLPTILWVYPQEFRSKDAASQVYAAENTFFRPPWSFDHFPADARLRRSGKPGHADHWRRRRGAERHLHRTACRKR